MSTEEERLHIAHFLTNHAYFKDSIEYQELRHFDMYHSLKPSYSGLNSGSFIVQFETEDLQFKICELDGHTMMSQISKPEESHRVSFEEILDIFELRRVLNRSRKEIKTRLELLYLKKESEKC